MIDLGKINEAENILLDSIDYTNNNEVIEVALFYQYLSEKDNKPELFTEQYLNW